MLGNFRGGGLNFFKTLLAENVNGHLFFKKYAYMMKAGIHMLLSYTLAYTVLNIALFINKLSTFVKIIQ